MTIGHAVLNEKPWTEGEIVRLRYLWSTELSTAAIGRKMNRSKGSIVGKAHKLLLPGRPSPIKHTKAEPKQIVGRKAGVSTLPPLASLSGS